MPELWFRNIAKKSISPQGACLEKNDLDILKAIAFDMYDFRVVNVHVDEPGSRKTVSLKSFHSRIFLAIGPNFGPPQTAAQKKH